MSYTKNKSTAEAPTASPKPKTTRKANLIAKQPKTKEPKTKKAPRHPESSGRNEEPVYRWQASTPTFLEGGVRYVETDPRIQQQNELLQQPSKELPTDANFKVVSKPEPTPKKKTKTTPSLSHLNFLSPRDKKIVEDILRKEKRENAEKEKAERRKKKENVVVPVVPDVAMVGKPEGKVEKEKGAEAERRKKKGGSEAASVREQKGIGNAEIIQAIEQEPEEVFAVSTVKRVIAKAQPETSIELQKEIPQVRHLKIQSYFRPIQSQVRPEPPYQIVPELRLSGYWLEKLGFTPEKYASVTTLPGLLIIRTME